MKQSKSFILKQALNKAVQAYNQEMARNSSDASFMSAGFFHGSKGKAKGIKASAYLEKILNTDHDALFLLLYCLMDSSSKSLATSIAEQLIHGSFTFTYGHSFETDEPSPSLSSHYFSEAQIQKHQDNALTIDSSGEYWGAGHVDPRKLVLSILKEQRRSLKDTEKKHFDCCVSKLKSNLRNTSNSAINMELLPPQEMLNSDSGQSLSAQ